MKNTIRYQTLLSSCREKTFPWWQNYLWISRLDRRFIRWLLGGGGGGGGGEGGLKWNVKDSSVWYHIHEAINNLPTTCEQSGNLATSQMSYMPVSVQGLMIGGKKGREAPIRKTENPPPSVCLSVLPLFILSACPPTKPHVSFSSLPPSLRTSTSNHAPFPPFLPSFRPLFLLLPSLSPSVAKTFICSEHFPYFMPCQPQVWAGRGIKICIIPEQNRAAAPWTQGRGEQLLAWRAVDWQHLLWENVLLSPEPVSLLAM